MHKLILLLLLTISYTHAQQKENSLLAANETRGTSEPDTVTKTFSLKFIVTPPETQAAISGGTLPYTQWQGTKELTGVPAGTYIIRARRPKCKPFDTTIVLTAKNDVEIYIEMRPDGHDFKIVYVQNEEVSEIPEIMAPIILDGKEWRYSLAFPGLGQIQQGRTKTGVVFMAAEVAALATYTFALLRYNPARNDYQAVIDRYRYTTFSKEKQIVLDKGAIAQKYYDIAFASVIVAGAVYIISAVEAYFFQPTPSPQNVEIYPAMKPERSGTNYSLGIKVRL